MRSQLSSICLLVIKIMSPSNKQSVFSFIILPLFKVLSDTHSNKIRKAGCINFRFRRIAIFTANYVDVAIRTVLSDKNHIFPIRQRSYLQIVSIFTVRNFCKFSIKNNAVDIKAEILINREKRPN